jgi:transposase
MLTVWPPLTRLGGVMVRSRRTKIAPEDKVRVVLSVLAGEMSGREAARRLGVSPDLVTKWKQQFLEAGAQRLEEVPSGSPGNKGTPEQRRLQMENEQLKLALAEATVQLRIWQRGAAFADQVPFRTSKP